MIEVALWFAFLILGSVAIVLALNLSYWAGQRYEERKSRRYLNTLRHLYEADLQHRPPNERRWP